VGRAKRGVWPSSERSALKQRLSMLELERRVVKSLVEARMAVEGKRCVVAEVCKPQRDL